MVRQLRACAQGTKNIAKSCMEKTKISKVERIRIQKIRNEFDPKEIF